ncbi:hypothetical protein HQ560_17080 [bacterium]|nr:hypothetical protein [bacterium]
MPRLAAVAAVLFALAAPLIADTPPGGGVLPASIAELQDYGGHLATLQAENENALIALGVLLVTPANKVPDIQKLADKWYEAAQLQADRFDVHRDGLISAFAEAHPKKTVLNISSLPPAYNSAFNEWKGQWNWLCEDGYQAYHRIKWFQLQVKLNEEINTPVAEQVWSFFEQQTGLLEKALRFADEAIRRRDGAAFKRHIEAAGALRSPAKTVTKLHKQCKTDWEKFFRETKPELAGKFVDWFNVWEVQPATWPALYKMKTAMLVLAGKGFDKYIKGYKKMKKAWEPIIEVKFLTDGRQFTKDLKIRTLEVDYRRAIDNLSRQMQRRR